MTNKTYVTSIRVTDVEDSKAAGGTQVVRGMFTFDGRIRSDQTGRFVTIVAPQGMSTHLETNFTVKVVKAQNVQWRDMKRCEQKAAIQSEITARVMNHLKGEQTENEKENGSGTQPGTEYDVETERALALESGEVEILTVEKVEDLNQVVARAAVEDSDDLLEIPNFLKRS